MIRVYFSSDGYIIQSGKVLCPDCGCRQPWTEEQEVWTCPKCQGNFRRGTRVRHVMMSRVEDRIILALPREGQQLEFHFRRGRAVLYTGEKILDVTEHEEFWKEHPTYALIAHHEKTKKYLHAFFEEVWGCALPYAPEEMSPLTAVRMVRFVGYPKPFYDAVPYLEDTWALPRSFRCAAKKLHLAKEVPKLLLSMEAVFPAGSKSVRRCVFEEPQLLFYRQELTKLWMVLGCVNIFCVFLSAGPELYRFLSFLHNFPQTMSFVHDYTRIAGAKRLLKLLRFPDTLENYAVGYAAMSGELRQQRQKEFRQKTLRPSLDHDNSIPAKLPAAAEAWSVDGYDFIPLRSSREYIRAGKALDNCLGHRLWSEGPVVLIRKGRRDAGAVEINDRLVTMTAGPHNEKLEPEADTALKKYMDHFGLKLDSFDADEEDGDPELCF